MPARVPLDVDLEDRLLYGLTPVRLAYVAIAVLAGFTLWSSPWGPMSLRGAAASLVIGVGAVVAWGRWRGTPADVWLVDLALFMVRTHRVIWRIPRVRIPRRKPSSPLSPAHAAETLTAAA